MFTILILIDRENLILPCDVSKKLGYLKCIRENTEYKANTLFYSITFMVRRRGSIKYAMLDDKSWFNTSFLVLYRTIGSKFGERTLTLSAQTIMSIGGSCYWQSSYSSRSI